VSIDTAHVRGSRSEKARIFEIAVARCGRGRRGSPPGHYFATADTSKQELRSRTLQALQREGYVGRGELTVISDGAEIMKRLPKALPQPTVHILDWFHIAMKVQPLQQMADPNCPRERQSKWPGYFDRRRHPLGEMEAVARANGSSD
jgi:hypothetical protein